MPELTRGTVLCVGSTVLQLVYIVVACSDGLDGMLVHHLSAYLARSAF